MDKTPSETRALATTDAPPMRAPGSTALILDPNHMQQMMAVAEVMARGISTVPRHLQKNTGDCLAVVMQATQWGMNPFAVAQKTHVVNGTLGYEAQLVNAVVNTMAPTRDRINYEWFGDWSKVMGKFEERQSKKKMDEDTGKPLTYRVPAWTIKDEADLGIRVWATMKGEDKPRELTLLLVQCRVRNSPLWADDPRQQIAYLAVKRWTRLHCPDVLLGVYTPDELADDRPPRDMGPADVVPPTIPQALLEAARNAADGGRSAFSAWWRNTKPADRALLEGEVAGLKARTEAADRRHVVDTPPTEPEPPSTPTDADSDGVVFATYAGVMDKMLKAKDTDTLDLAADWIRFVSDSGQREELSNKYNALRAALVG